MPIYIRIDGIKGDVQPAGAATGGVWKTSNFLTTEPVGPASREPGLPGVTVFLDQNNSSGSGTRTKIKTYLCPSDPSVVPVSRISLSPGGGGVEGGDPAAKIKVEQMINSARSQGPNGRLYVATNVGVYQSGAGFDGQGKLLIGAEAGIYRSGSAAKFAKGTNNLHQLGLGTHNSASIELIVTDASGRIETGFRIENARASQHSGVVQFAFGDGSVRSLSRGVGG